MRLVIGRADSRAPAPGGLDNQRQAGRAYLATPGLKVPHRARSRSMLSAAGFPRVARSCVGSPTDVRSLAFVEQAITNRIANATYVLDLGLQHPAVLANSNFVNLQPC